MPRITVTELVCSSIFSRTIYLKLVSNRAAVGSRQAGSTLGLVIPSYYLSGTVTGTEIIKVNKTQCLWKWRNTPVKQR